MVSWAWIPAALLTGVAAGIVLMAFMQVSRQDDQRKRWWEE